MSYVTYLRKSRADLDLERLGSEDTLARHRRTLAELAERLHLPVTAVYEEVVSGDSISARPQMQRLLQEVEQGAWEGVLVMEVERLARGDTMDQGLVANAFKYSGTKIVTPQKVYDPASDIDEEYFEFSLFMSRREYKTINRRLKEGKRAAMREGKFTGSTPPFGYDKVRVQGSKGWMLVPNEHADTVRAVFEQYLRKSWTRDRIARGLNAQGITTTRGNDWTEQAVKAVLENPHYAGFTTDVRRPVHKTVRDGVVVRERPLNPDRRYYRALHEPLITEADHRAAVERLERDRKSRAPRVFGFQNPLNSLVYCDKCGRTMHRLHTTEYRIDYLKCPNRRCSTIMHPLPDVERLILDALRDWYADFTAAACQPEAAAPQLAELKLKRSRLLSAQSDLTEREDRLYELLESRIYSDEEFARRRARLAQERTALAAELTETEAAITEAEQLIVCRAELAPRVAHVLDTYASTRNMEDRNRLLKSILRRVDYHKTIRATKARPDTDISVQIFPLLPVDF